MREKPGVEFGVKDTIIFSLSGQRNHRTMQTQHEIVIKATYVIGLDRDTLASSHTLSRHTDSG